MPGRFRTASPVINASLALIEVDRAITDLRRGGLVIVSDAGGAYLVQAAEAITAECLARFAALSGKPLALALTSRRAAALQLVAAPTSPGGTMLPSLPEPIEPRFLRRVAEARVPLADAEDTQIIAFRPSDGGIEHLAIVIGSPDPALPVLTRLHSECFTGDLLGSLRCDCGDQLRGAIAEIARAG